MLKYKVFDTWYGGDRVVALVATEGEAKKICRFCNERGLAYGYVRITK
jgi:hypothetical protein